MGKFNNNNNNNKSLSRQMRTYKKPQKRGPRAHVPPRNNLTRAIGVTQTLRRTLGLASYNYATIVSGGTSGQTWIANSAYHPYSTVDMNGYSTYMAMYTKCWVLGGRCTVKVVCSPGSFSTYDLQSFFGFGVNTNSASLPTIDELLENGRSTFGALGRNPDTITMSSEWDVADFLGKPFVLDDPELYSTVSSTPLSQIGCHLVISNKSSQTLNYHYFFFLELEVVFTDPKVLT